MVSRCFRVRRQLTKAVDRKVVTLEGLGSPEQPALFNKPSSTNRQRSAATVSRHDHTRRPRSSAKTQNPTVPQIKKALADNSAAVAARIFASFGRCSGRPGAPETGSAMLDFVSTRRDVH